MLSNKYRRENAFSLVRHTEPAARLALRVSICPYLFKRFEQAKRERSGVTMNIEKTIVENEIIVSTEKDRYGRDNWLYTKRYFFQTEDKRAAMISTTVNLVKLPKRQGYLVANWGRGAAAPVATFMTIAAAREFALTDLLEVHAEAVEATK
ncbi:hypothetical protein SEA_PIPPA_76 [Arthrobacter phage Pippa]|nr:hypothetical protein SEA_PIPPA_76 [Arthrobacter phage Pippa]